MVHSDDTGLVLPPRIAPTQVVVITIPPSAKTENGDEIMAQLRESAASVTAALTAAGVRVVNDTSTNTPGWKYNFHELRGVPLRLEIGAADLKQNAVTAVRRVDGSKASLVSIPCFVAARSCTELVLRCSVSFLNSASPFCDWFVHCSPLPTWRTLSPASSKPSKPKCWTPRGGNETPTSPLHTLGMNSASTSVTARWSLLLGARRSRAKSGLRTPRRSCLRPRKTAKLKLTTAGASMAPPRRCACLSRSPPCPKVKSASPATARMPPHGACGDAPTKRTVRQLETINNYPMSHESPLVSCTKYRHHARC